MMDQELYNGFVTGWMTFVIGIGLALSLRIISARKAKKQAAQISNQAIIVKQIHGELANK